MRRFRIAALLGALLSLLVAVPATAKDEKPDRGTKQAYIVVLREGTGDPEGAANRHGARARHVFRHALRGYAADLSEAQVARLRADPDVTLVEPDLPMEAIDTQSSATWGLDRVDQRNLPLSGTYSYDGTAPSVTAYVIDTGIRTDHTQFGGRASKGFDAFGGSGEDCNGHGTHVAGTIGGATHGVAKQVKLVAVRVLNCRGSGTTSGVIAGVDWVTANATKPAVANMSLGGGASSALDQAVTSSISSGITYAVAAGNSSANACSYSPARAAAALTVGATTSSDARASYSNYGSCLDLFAPGSSITSAWSTSTTATNTISGTSMASPHVAGVAALVLDDQGGLAPAQVGSAITGAATTGKVSSAGSGSPNRLLYSDPGAVSPPPPDDGNQAPTASFTRSCTSGSTSTCTFTSTSTDQENQTLAHAWTGATPTGSATVATRTVSGNGSYTVTLTVTDSAGAPDSDSRTISCSWTGKGKKKTTTCS